MKHDSYLFPMLDRMSLEIIYPNLSQEPWVKFDLSDGSKTITLSLNPEQLESLTFFLKNKTA